MYFLLEKELIHSVFQTVLIFIYTHTGVETKLAFVINRIGPLPALIYWEIFLISEII